MYDVMASVGHCWLGIDWWTEDFRREFGKVPQSVDEVRELLAGQRCEICGAPVVLESAGAYGDDPEVSLWEWDRDG